MDLHKPRGPFLREDPAPRGAPRAPVYTIRLSQSQRDDLLGVLTSGLVRNAHELWGGTEGLDDLLEIVIQAKP